jgi:hypothetical protein
MKLRISKLIRILMSTCLLATMALVLIACGNADEAPGTDTDADSDSDSDTDMDSDTDSDSDTDTTSECLVNPKGCMMI